MTTHLITTFDKNINPTSQILSDDGYSRAGLLKNGVLYVGTYAIPDGSQYRFEIRKTGRIPDTGITTFPTPTSIVSFQATDANAYIGSIAVHPSTDIYFTYVSAGHHKLYKFASPTLSVEDAGAGSFVAPAIVKSFNEEIVIGYSSLIRYRSAAGVWATLASPTSPAFTVVAMFQYLNKLFILVNNTTLGKAEAWTYSGLGAALVLDNAWTATSTWLTSYRAGGLYKTLIYGSITSSGADTGLWERLANGSWSLVNPGLQIGEIVEHRGNIYGLSSVALQSPGSDPTQAWSTVATIFGAELIVF